MRVSMNDDARDRLGEEAYAALRAAPDDFELSVSRGQSGWGATLTRRNWFGASHLLGDTKGHAEPSDAIEAVMEQARPKPRLI